MRRSSLYRRMFGCSRHLTGCSQGASERGMEGPQGEWEGVNEMKKSKKASARVTAPNQEASAAAAEAKTASRRKAASASAVENVARRQFQKSQATAIQGHMRASGQRRQAKRDAR